MERVLRRMLGILTHLFCFSVLAIMAGISFPQNAITVIVGIAGFYGLLICVNIVIIQIIMSLIKLVNGNNSDF